MSHRGELFDAERWKEVSRIYRRAMGLALGRKSGRAEVKNQKAVTMNTAEILASEDNETVLPDPGMAKMLRCRVRCFTDGAVFGREEGWCAADEGERQGGSGGAVEHVGSPREGWKGDAGMLRGIPHVLMNCAITNPKFRRDTPSVDRRRSETAHPGVDGRFNPQGAGGPEGRQSQRGGLKTRGPLLIFGRRRLGKASHDL